MRNFCRILYPAKEDPTFVENVSEITWELDFQIGLR